MQIYLLEQTKPWSVVSISPPTGWSHWGECIEWCYQNIDPNSRSWQYVGEGVFTFEFEKSALMFALRWS
jgi:hypothetical protein